ncbi:MAG: hypothetical protein JWM49_1591 [Microbacteriaceae bacterium]|nr:hypothetical protein [Microbacteriaceae bacterium]
MAKAATKAHVGRTVDGPVYRSTFVVPEAVPVVSVDVAPSVLVVWLFALLPLAQLAVIVLVLAPLHLLPGVGYALLVAPSLGLLLSAALRRAQGQDKHSTGPMAFAVVPPLYLSGRTVTLSPAAMAPVITWLLLAGVTAAVLLFA